MKTYAYVALTALLVALVFGITLPEASEATAREGDQLVYEAKATNARLIVGLVLLIAWLWRRGGSATRASVARGRNAVR